MKLVVRKVSWARWKANAARRTALRAKQRERAAAVLLVRKVNWAKWKPGARPGEIRADAVTVDLRTKDDTLSFWAVGGSGPPTPDELANIALALAFGLLRPDKIELVCVPAEALTAAGIEIEATPGATPVADLRNRHRDAVRLDLDRLGAAARLVAEVIRSRADAVIAYKRDRIEAAMKQALSSGKVALAEVNEQLREWIEENWPGVAPADSKG